MNNFSLLLFTLFISANFAAFPMKAGNKPDTPGFDFSGGISRLESFGFPDAANAQFVKLDFSPDVKTSLNLYSAPLEDTAWLLPEKSKDGQNAVTERFIIYGVRTENLGRQISSTLSRARKRFRPADPDYETEYILYFLKQSAKQKYIDDDFLVRAFVFALHLYQRGDKKDAGKIFREITSFQKDNRVILVRILNELAFAQYDSVYRKFLKNHNWREFHDSLQQIISKFGAVWSAHGYMKKLLARTELNADGGTAEYSGIAKLPSAEQKLAGKMLQIKTIIHHNIPYRNNSFFSESANDQVLPWLLPEFLPAEIRNKIDPVVLEIRKMGLRAIPFLVSLLEDKESLTTLDFNIINNTYSPPFFTDDDDINNRPATRGELAKYLLYTMLLKEEDESDSEETVAMLPETAMEFYKKYNGKPRSVLTLEYLKRNAETQRFEIALLKEAHKRQIPELEKFLVNICSVENHTVKQLRRISAWDLTARAAFLAAYSAARGKRTALLKDMADNITELAEALYHVDTAKQTGKDKTSKEKENKKNKSLFIEDKNERADMHLQYQKDSYNSLTKLAARIRTFNPETDMNRLFADFPDKEDADRDYFLIQFLGYRLQMMKPEKAEQVLLDALAKEKSIIRKEGIFSLLQEMLSYAVSQGEKISHATNRDLWIKLLDDTSRFSGGRRTFAESAAKLYEISFSAGNFRKKKMIACYTQIPSEPEMLLRGFYGPEGVEFVKNRIIRKLAGTPENELPPYPSQKEFTDKQFSELAEKLENAESQEELRKTVDSLSIYELFHLKELLGRKGKLNSKLLKLSGIVSEIDVKTDDDSVARFKAWKGKPVTPELVKLMSEYTRSHLGDNKCVDCRLVILPCFRGFRIEVTRKLPDERYDPNSYAYRNREPGEKFPEDDKPAETMKGIVFEGDIYASAILKYPPGDQGGQRIQELYSSVIRPYFDENVKKFVAGTKRNAAARGMLRFTTCKNLDETEEDNNKAEAVKSKKMHFTEPVSKNVKIIIPDNTLSEFGKKQELNMHSGVNRQSADELLIREFRKHGITLFKPLNSLEGIPGPEGYGSNEYTEQDVTFDLTDMNGGFYLKVLDYESQWVFIQLKNGPGEFFLKGYQPSVRSFAESLKHYQTEKKITFGIMFFPFPVMRCVNTYNHFGYRPEDCLLSELADQAYVRAMQVEQKRMEKETFRTLGKEVDEIAEAYKKNR